MSYKINPFTGEFDEVGDSNLEIDGGFANSVYLPVQSIDGGGANG